MRCNLRAKVMTDQAECLAVFSCNVREEAIAGKIGPPKLDKGGRRHYCNMSFRFAKLEGKVESMRKEKADKQKSEGSATETGQRGVESVLYNCNNQRSITARCECRGFRGPERRGREERSPQDSEASIRTFREMEFGLATNTREALVSMSHFSPLESQREKPDALECSSVERSLLTKSRERHGADVMNGRRKRGAEASRWEELGPPVKPADRQPSPGKLHDPSCWRKQRKAFGAELQSGNMFPNTPRYGCCCTRTPFE